MNSFFAESVHIHEQTVEERINSPFHFCSLVRLYPNSKYATTGSKLDAGDWRVLRRAAAQPMETPKSRPMAAVTAMAKPPPIVTRNAAGPIGAPPR
jgi:hypothetical protein